MAVIEIARMRLRPGVADEAFVAQNRIVDRDHVRAQPGFVSRELARSADGEWIVVVHWDTPEAADASMATFASAPAAARFMALVDPDTLSMRRYLLLS